MKNQSSPGNPKAIDWDDLFRRLEAARTPLQMEISPEEEKRILKARGAALAMEPLHETGSEGKPEILEFLLSGERYGMEMTWVRETSPLRDLTPLPCTPPFVLGLIHLRGEIISVIDLKKFFDLPERGLTDLNRVIILHGEQMTFGILADEIIGINSISNDAIQPPLPTLTGIRKEYLRGIIGEGTILLDARKILTDRRIIVEDED